MSTEKKVSTATKVIYWVSTALIGLPAISGIFFLNSEMAKEGMKHMQMPQWFAYESGIGSFLGGLIILIPLWKRLKEWNYVALGIMYLSAFIGHLALDGFGSNAIQAIITFGILVVSYIYYHKIND
jgi:uncharacterized membrane protein YphA (DoxX/SURF4 family)